MFVEERLDRKSLLITRENHVDVKERFTERLEAMITYVTNDSKCRASMLLEYFGQESQRCGNCDVCLSRNELDLSKYEFDLILDKVKQLLSSREMEIDELIAKSKNDEDDVIKVVRWLLDRDKILKDKSNKLTWNSLGL